MKLSVSLPDDDVAFLDECVRSCAFASRSAAVHKAIRLLQGNELQEAYEEAFAAWETEGEAELWDLAVADGLPGRDGAAGDDAAG